MSKIGASIEIAISRPEGWRGAPVGATETAAPLAKAAQHADEVAPERVRDALVAGHAA